jgi:hypothetical protein
MELEKEVFAGKSIQNLVEELYNKQKNQEEFIQSEIKKLSQFIEGPGDAVVMIPFITDLLESNTKNSELLVKLLNLFKQSSESKKNNEASSGVLSEKDIQQLFEEVSSIDFKKQQKQIGS